MTCEITSLSQAQTLSLLVVEDEGTIHSLYKEYLLGCFKNIFYTTNANEALEIFEKHKIDMLICDQDVSIMSGLHMIEQLKLINSELLIILITACEDASTLRKAITLNISHFLLKPFSKEELFEVIKDVIEPIILQKLFEKQNLDYMNSLKNYEKYNKQEQVKAFTKQSNAIKNDFYYQYIQYKEHRDIWYLNGFYKPYEILHGDTYSIRKIDDEKVIFFIIDAMGKGVCASISSIIALTMINNYIDFLCIEQKKDLSALLSKFIADIKTILHEEEVLSILFVQMNIAEETMDIASFAMPPVLFVDIHQKCLKIPANNIPISKSHNSMNISSHNIKDIDKMLFCSDGIFEASLPDGSLYFKHIEKDFLHAHNRYTFVQKFLSTVTKTEDDITLLWINRLQEHTQLTHKKVLSTSRQAIDAAITEFEAYLTQKSISLIDKSKLCLMAVELLTNAYEHGNLGITQEEKKELVVHNTLKSRCQDLEKVSKHKKIYFHYDIKRKSDLDFIFIKIEDEGDGFDSALLKQQVFSKSAQVSGRGFSMAKKISDALYFSPKGNTVIVNKCITKESI